MKLQYTIGLVATLSLLAACGSKKQKPIEEKSTAAPAVAPMTPAQYNGVGVACSNGQVSPEKLQTAAHRYFTTNQNNEYVSFSIEDGNKGATEKGTFKTELADPKDPSKGRMIFIPVSRVVDGKELIKPDQTTPANSAAPVSADSTTQTTATTPEGTSDGAATAKADTKTEATKSEAEAASTATAASNPSPYQFDFMYNGTDLTLKYVDTEGSTCAKGETVAVQFKRAVAPTAEAAAPTGEAVSTSK
jgi:hypothetical protein